MNLSSKIQSKSACSTLTIVGVLAVTGILFALKYARDSNSKAKKTVQDNADKHEEDLRETIRKRAEYLRANADRVDPARHTIKTNFPKLKPAHPQSDDPQF